MCGEGRPHGGCRRMLEKLRKGIMSDYIFCNTLDELIELGCVFLLLAFSAVIVRDFSLFAYLNIICTNCLTVLLYMLSRHVFKNLFFKDMLIFLFFLFLAVFYCDIILTKKIRLHNKLLYFYRCSVDCHGNSCILLFQFRSKD